MNKYFKGTMWAGLSVLTCMGLAACGPDAGATGGNQAASGSTAAAQAAPTAPQAQASGPVYAKVLSATPIKQTVNHPEQQCHTEAVTVAKPVKDKHDILGSAIGAVAGGLLGNQVGGGNGKKLATVAGAVAGGVAGNRIQKHHQENATQTVNKQVCKTVNNPTTRITGYTVKYEYNGQTHTTRMSHDPGAQVEIKQGVSVVGG